MRSRIAAERRSRSVVMEIALLLALSLLLAIAAWRLHPLHFPLRADRTAYELDLLYPLVRVDAALASYEEGLQVFIDARSAERFAESRIPGAMNVRLDRFDGDLREIYDFILPEDRLLIYDDGMMLEASAVAGRFARRGFPRVELLRGGFTAWQAGGGETSGADDE